MIDYILTINNLEYYVLHKITEKSLVYIYSESDYKTVFKICNIF